MASGIYCILHRDTGRRYIGQSVDIQRRWRRHKQGNSNPHLGNALKKYGHEAFDWIILEEVEPERLTEREQHWLDHFSGEVLFNEIRQVQDGPRHSEATRKKISASKMGTKLSDEHKAKVSAFNKGKTLTPEHRAKLSAAKTGQSVSPEARAKISAKLKGRKLTPEHCANMGAVRVGKRHTPETIAKCSAVKLGKKFTEEHRAALRAAWVRRKLKNAAMVSAA